MSDDAKPWDLFNPNIDKVDYETWKARVEVCNACDQLIKLTHQCKKCGCFMNLKAKLPHAKCPLGRWIE